MRVIVIGATGLTGEYLVRQMSLHPSITHIDAIVRFLPKSQSSSVNENSTLNYIVCNDGKFDETMQAHFNNSEDGFYDCAFCCLGTTIKKAGSEEMFKQIDHDLVLKFAKLAKNNNVKHFLAISSVGASSRSNNFYLKVKGQVEDELRNVQFSKLSIFRPSLLLGKRTEARLGEGLGQLLAPVFSLFLFGKFKKYQPVEGESLAKAILVQAINSDVQLDRSTDGVIVDVLEAQKIKALWSRYSQ